MGKLRISPAEKAAYDNLRSAESELKGLVKETAHAVGAIAKHGYKSLLALPGEDAATPWGVINEPGVRPAEQKNAAHSVTVPLENTTLPYNPNYGIASTVAVTNSDNVKFGIFTIPLSAPIRRVQLTLVPQVLGLPNHDMHITAHSHAQHNKTKFTPRDIYNPYNETHAIYPPEKFVYTPDQLRSEYSAAYSGRLAVASIVAASLEAAHGITSDTSALASLTNDWQRFNPGNGYIAPNLVDISPPYIAAIAGEPKGK